MVQWLARLPGTQEIRGSSPGRGMTNFCTSIFICLYLELFILQICQPWKIHGDCFNYTVANLSYVKCNNKKNNFFDQTCCQLELCGKQNKVATMS